MPDLNIMGHPVSKPVVFIGSGIVVVGGVLIWRKKAQEKAAASATASTSASAAVGLSTASTSVATGYSYGATYPDEYGMSLYPGTGILPSTSATISTNAEWTQAAALYLENTAGMQANSVLTALGNGLSGAYISPSQVQIWDAAVAVEGEPPQAHPPLNTTAPKGSGGQGYQAYAPGGKTLAELATADGTTYDALAKENPSVAKKYMGKALPKGTGYYVPEGWSK